MESFPRTNSIEQARTLQSRIAYVIIIDLKVMQTEQPHE